ncbi:MAG: hypothetical protein JSW58_08500 [Candidatus Latescibacterota bacterium]|nr:MAG: hypothetical protein JSW58_08500 [Candidatus Latescibacterota bacterium]
MTHTSALIETLRGLRNEDRELTGNWDRVTLPRRILEAIEDGKSSGLWILLKRNAATEALGSTKFNVSKASSLLDISRRTMHLWAKEFHLTKEGLNGYETEEKVRPWRDQERDLVIVLLKKYEGDHEIISKRMGIEPKTLRSKIAYYNLRNFRT